MTRGLFSAVLGLAAVAAPLAAQRAQLELDGSRISADSQPAFNGIAATALLDGSTRGFYGAIVASGAHFDGSWLGQGRASGSALVPLHTGGRTSVEAAATAGGSVLSGDRWFASGTGVLRLHRQLGRGGGLWLGALGGVGRNSGDSASVSLAGPQAGGWMLGRRWSSTLTAALEWYEGRMVPGASGQVMAAAGVFDLAGWAGVRGPATADGSTSAWIGASVVLWMQPFLALVASAASYPSDLLEGVPGGSYVSIGVRVATRRVGIGEPRPTGRPSFVVPEGREVRVTLPGARTVELAGDWTAWKPVRLESAGSGTWRLRVRLPSGTYRFALRADGGPWMVPPGIPSQPDGFGGQVALLVVE